MDIIKQLAEFRAIPVEELHDEADLSHDLGFGSMDILEFVSMLEGEAGVQIDTAAAGNVRTVGDLKRLFSGD